METIKSAPLKAAPSPFEPTTRSSEAAVRLLIGDYLWLVQGAGQRSAAGIDGAQLATVSDGRVFTGNQALPLKLVDEIGGEKQAVAWLERRRASPRICRSATGTQRTQVRPFHAAAAWRAPSGCGSRPGPACARPGGHTRP